MKRILLFGVAVVTLSFPGSTVVSAQTFAVPRVEVGGQVGWVGALGACFCAIPIVGPRLTVNVSQQDAVEISADTLLPTGPAMYGFYFVQYKRTTRRPSQWNAIRPFYTAGAGGHYRHYRVGEWREPRPDGSVIVHPAHSTGDVSRLNMATFGGGFERGLSRYASFRLDVGGFAVLDNGGYFGYRVLAGVSVPIGGYRVNLTPDHP